MAKLRDIIAAQWDDIKGNAKWDFIKWGIVGCVTIPTGLAGFAKFVAHAPLWEALVIFIAAAVILFLIFVSLLRWISNSSKAIKPKRKTKEERLKEAVDKIARRNFPERFSDLEIEAVPFEIRNQGALKYACQIKIKNRNKNSAIQNLEVKLTILDPRPTAIAVSVPNAVLPNTFPIWLKPQSGDGKIINPHSELLFHLFTMPRLGNIPAVQFIGRDIEYNSFQPHVMWNVLVNPPQPICEGFAFRIEASALTCAPTSEQYWLSFSRDSQGIATFRLEKIGDTFIVHSALYHIEDKAVDVTEIVRSHVSNGKLEVLSGNQLGGDPRPGMGKVLTIEYSVDGKKLRKQIPEGQIADLPDRSK